MDEEKSSHSYMTSPLRNQARSQVERKMRRHQVQFSRRPETFGNIFCPICAREFEPDSMDFHEIVARGQIADKEALLEYPYQLNILLCRDCHDGESPTSSAPDPHSKLGQSYLLFYVIQMWGREEVRKAVDAFNALLIMPIEINYQLLEE